MSYQADLVEVHFQDPGANSDKFYRAYHIFDEEAPDDHRVLFQWGRRGSKGQSKVEVCHGVAHAKSTLRDKINSKEAKGYREVLARHLPAVSDDLLELAGINRFAVNANVRSQDPFAVFAADVDRCRRLVMGDSTEQAEAFTLRADLRTQLDTLRRGVSEAEGQVEVVEMLLTAKVGA